MNPDDDELFADEVELDNGFSIWGITAIMVNGIGEVAEVMHTACQHLAVGLAYRHNIQVDKANFITTIRTGLDRL